LIDVIVLFTIAPAVLAKQVSFSDVFICMSLCTKVKTVSEIDITL